MAEADKKLTRYRQMRDFSQTAEPAGAEKTKPSNRLRFVIQKHAATRLHYDFRLELDGVFLSWAVTKGPSLNTADRRLAVQTEDHPLDYGDFEGTIPKGQYGGGTVMLWDRGYWEPQGDAHAMLKKGDFKFRLDGERLQGSFVLVRMKKRDFEKKENWLLIKHHDGHELDEAGPVETELTSIASGRTMEEIAAGKGKGPKPFMTGGKARASAKAVWQSNRAEKQATEEKPRAAAALKAAPPPKLKAAALPGFVPPELTKPVDRPPPGAGWGHEIKFDGYRLQLRVQKGKATVKTRKGLDWSGKFKEIALDAGKLPDGIYDGEACALDHNGSPDFPALQAAISDGKTKDLIYFAFDVMFLDGEDLRQLPLRERKARLKAALDDAGKKVWPRIRYVDHFETAGDAVLQSACRMSLEGIVSKRLDAPYRSGRSENWVKAKCRAGHEVVIGGWSGEAGQLRSLLVGVYRDDKLVYVGRVGTGFGRDTVARVLPRLQKVAAEKSPFTGPNAPKKEANLNWARPELVAEIEFAGFTGGGMVRQGAFKGLREDKPAQEVEAETPMPVDSELAEPTPKKATAKSSIVKAPSSDAVVMGVVISNPNKALWPDDGTGKPITKLELARYLETVGPWMMRHIEGRPCSIIRTPDGINGDQRFFQRHAGKGSSALITEVEVFGDHKPYLQLDRIEALAAMAQIGAVEYHPWGNQPYTPEVPGRLIFDLDPDEDIPFERVIEGALTVKAKLEELGLVPFCKTTGGKGLHVVTPLKGGKGQIDWKIAKKFAQDVCLEIAAREPAKYVVNMAKAKRVGRIFLDYLRNDRMSTAVAPLSPRARPLAPVSFPITWDLVKPGLDPKNWTIRTAPALLKKTKAWADYFDSERPLEPAIRKLGR
ncbi:MAG TPA: DNA ligase D [Phenylobacterium sp.]